MKKIAIVGFNPMTEKIKETIEKGIVEIIEVNDKVKKYAMDLGKMNDSMLINERYIKEDNYFSHKSKYHK